MLFATHPRLIYFRLLALLVVFGGLASGCQSSRPSFSFRPEPGRARAVEAAGATAAAPESAAIATASTPTKPATQSVVTPPVTRKQRRPLRQPKLAVVSTENATAAQPFISHPAARHRRALLRRPHATAEAGLGTTVLGVLGLVVLPIALIGLLLSGGGLVWGIVAGAAALAVLVAYLDPFG